MLGISNKLLLPVLLLVFTGPYAHAQTDELLPEVDAYGKLNSNLRLWFQAKQTREAGDPIHAEIGPSLDSYLKPFIRLKGATEFDLDDSKSRPLVFSIGYRYLPEANGDPSTNRMEPVVTFNFPLKGKVLFSDRNRGDLDWKNGAFTWRYRNRIQFERTFQSGSYHWSPYVSSEFFYTSQYSKWSDTAIYVGCLFPFHKHFEFNPYYEHQNNTGTTPNQQLNQLGLMLNLYFSAR
jgi:Protein of unknown function (DUF2490)